MTPVRLCLEPRCPNPAEVRGRCRIHATEARKANRSVNDAFYSSLAWRMARRRQLFEFPLCQFLLENGRECGVVADSVHHIVELTLGGAPRDPENLQSLCRAHHSVTHAQRRRWEGSTY
jgi:5-methylcytosine-specific restriction endonuclease McrA